MPLLLVESVMLPPPVTLQFTATARVSPALVKPNAAKSADWFSTTLTVGGKTTSWARPSPTPVATGRSQFATAAASTTARDRARRSFKRASRRDSLCLNAMVVIPPTLKD